MSQWWPLLAAFWAAFLFDCIKAGRRPRFLFTSAGGRRARWNFGPVVFSLPSPRGWHAFAEDVPYSFSTDGISNIAVGSASRPVGEPDVARAWRWEDIKDVSERKGLISINGLPFCPVSPFASAKTLRELAATCVALPAAARTTHLAGLIGSWFRPAYLRRRLTALRGRTASLADLLTINFVLTFVATLYLLLDGPAWIGEMWAARVARALPWILGYAVVLHLAVLVLAWRAHRHLQPKAADERFSLVLNAFFLPPQALRLRAQISHGSFHSQHPLVWFAVAGSRDALERHARQVLSDLRWPLPPRRIVDPALVFDITGWMRERVAVEVARILQRHAVSAESLLAPPRPDSPTSCMYCPRCRDQFSGSAAQCPRGLVLQTLK